jgi:hypothetical protein
MRRVLMAVGYVLGAIVALALVAWLMTGGLQQLLSWMPPGVRKIIGEPGTEKVMPARPDPNGAPWEKRGYQPSDDETDTPMPKMKPSVAGEPEESAEEAATPDENAVEPAARPEDEAAAAAVLAPIRSLDEAAGTAIEAYERNPEDQGKYLTAEKAVATLRTFAPADGTASALRTAATELRDERAVARAEALTAARAMGRATHKVHLGEDQASPFLAVREAANTESRLVAELLDGTLVRVFLDNGNGWYRVEAVTGESAGKGGYARGKWLQKLPRPK